MHVALLLSDVLGYLNAAVTHCCALSTLVEGSSCRLAKGKQMYFIATVSSSQLYFTEVDRKLLK